MKKDNLVTETFKFGTYVVDAVLVIFAVYLSFLLVFQFDPPSYNIKPFINIIPYIVVAYWIFMYVFGLNDLLKKSIHETVYSIFLTVGSLFITTAFITFFARGFAYPRSVLIISAFMQFIILSVWRVLVWKLYRDSHGVKRSLIIGDKNIEDIAKKILIKQKDLYKVECICSSKSNYLLDYLNKVEVVFVADSTELSIKKKIVDYCLINRKSVYIIPDIYEIALLNSKLNRADDIPMFKVRKLGLTIEQKAIKRILDIIVSLVGIILTSPIMIIVAIAIKLKDGGNIFYRQERVTEGERTFDVLKFRTMVMNAEKLTGPVLAGEEDPRITKIGKILRATRLDELPQFFNILKGDMSVVGPRPERPFFVEQFKKEIPDYKYRTLVKAGLTGLAQVLGKYSTTPEDKVKYDLLYIKNYSIFLDLKLILQTVKIMFMKESSEGVKEDIPLRKLIKPEDEITIDIDEK
ncbi:sugar transferase [Clostridium fallax]|uniref:Exopolysaccharide biosynthesis polyprenyl glycosylphosphotransferase n=1 Tax=Clostridium fallax TaxID=1533 RepID=A0A1M4WQM6_9CLOT|nr:sugar transferase [Clostridium fallax]SHE83373.1 exopolysaccharide biosynthesis polyprenyl glycosylphosphotransferase [Clostridium fallax]SQB06270.1 exopolysaccharide biosynthesis polyprenyl glycosylphosphotransferase [Clostridium fallax]